MGLTSSEIGRKESGGEILISVSFQVQTPSTIAGGRPKYSVSDSCALLTSTNSVLILKASGLCILSCTTGLGAGLLLSDVESLSLSREVIFFCHGMKINQSVNNCLIAVTHHPCLSQIVCYPVQEDSH